MKPSAVLRMYAAAAAAAAAGAIAYPQYADSTNHKPRYAPPTAKSSKPRNLQRRRK